MCSVFTCKIRKIICIMCYQYIVLISEEKEIVVQEVPDTEDKSFRPPEVPPEVSQVLLDNKAKSSDHNSDDIGV